MRSLAFLLALGVCNAWVLTPSVSLRKQPTVQERWAVTMLSKQEKLNEALEAQEEAAKRQAEQVAAIEKAQKQTKNAPAPRAQKREVAKKEKVAPSPSSPAPAPVVEPPPPPPAAVPVKRSAAEIREAAKEAEAKLKIQASARARAEREANKAMKAAEAAEKAVARAAAKAEGSGKEVSLPSFGGSATSDPALVALAAGAAAGLVPAAALVSLRVWITSRRTKL